MRTSNKWVSIEEIEDKGVDVHIDVPSAWSPSLLEEMAWQSGSNGVQRKRGEMSAFFTDEAKAQRFAAEAVTYTDQQDWLESIDEDEAKEYAIVFE